MSEAYDVLIVGAGVAGTALGAILASREGMKVLVLEKAPKIGGRDVSFMGTEIDENYLRVIRGAAKTWLYKASPDFKTLLKEGTLHGYALEAGIHVLPVSENGRVNFLMRYLGKELPLYPVCSAGIFQGDELYRFEDGSERGGNFPWMSEADIIATAEINRAMVKMKKEEARKLNHVSLAAWLDRMTDNAKAKEFHAVNATLNCTINDPGKISAGDLILMNRAIARGGKRFSQGGCATVPSPGFIQVPGKFAEVIAACGGKVITDAPVTELIVEDGKCLGVRATVGGSAETIKAPLVVSTVPIRDIFRIIGEEHFPTEFVNKIKSFWSSGAACVYYGLSREVVKEHMTFVPRLLTAADGFDADVRMGYWASSSMDPGRAPYGKQLLDCYISLIDYQAYDHGLIGRSFAAMDEFMKTHYPGFAENLEWALYTVTDSLIAVAQAPGQVGDARPRSECPWISGLYFASDTAECWAAANDAAVHSTIICAGAISGRDYAAEILPEYHI